jgi:type I restriction enzyme S subunit
MSKTQNSESGVSLADLPALPLGWCWATLNRISQIQGGIQKQPSRAPRSNSFPYLRVANVLRGRLDLDEIHRMELFDGELEKLRLQTGDLLVVEGNGSKTEIGRSALWHGEIENCVHQNHIIRVRLLAGEPKFIDHYWNSSEGNGRVIDAAASTSGLYTLSIRKISSLPVPLAPLNEQRRIVAKIEELFSDLDAGVAALERIRANLKRYRAAVLKAAVEGRLTEEWRSKHAKTEPATNLLERILAERRQKWEEDQLVRFTTAEKTPPKGWCEKYTEPAAPDTSGLPELPQGWCWATVEQVSEFTRYGSSAKTSADCAGVPVLRMGNIQDGSLDLDDLKYLPQEHHEFPDLLLREGDLLFNRTNSAELVGKTAVYRGKPNPCSYASYLIAVRTVCGCNPEFLCYYLNSWYGRAWVASVVSQQVGQANVNGTKLQALVFPLPPEAEQSKIVAEVELRFSNIAAAQAQVDANLKRAARLRQSILKRTFEGKLVPQDPTDEPAKKLLDRIRQERTATNGSVAPRARRGRASSPQTEGETDGAAS